MPTSRLYIKDDFTLNHPLTLSQTHSQHICKVLRLKEGDLLHIFNEKQGEFEAQLQQPNNKHAVIIPTNQIKPPFAQPSCQLHLAQAISRGDRMDYTIQKATELGVTSITPILSERCGVKLSSDRMQKKLDHWQGVLISAAQQCGRLDIPELHPPIQLSEWLNKQKVGVSLACLVSKYPNPLLNIPTDTHDFHILVGPEGGFSTDEVAAIQTHHVIAWQMGPRVLRTETAGVVALSLLQYQFGDLSS